MHRHGETWRALAAIGSLFTAVAAVLIAIFRQRMEQWARRPRLEIKYSPCAPFFVKTILRSTGSDSASEDCYYIRFQVSNNGSANADQVEASIRRVRKRHADGDYHVIEEFLPNNLLWSNIGRTNLERISRGTEKYCDLGHIVKPRGRQQFPQENYGIDPAAVNTAFLATDVFAKPFTGTHILGPGDYEIDIVVAASNTNPIKRTFSVNFLGEWFDDVRVMLERGIGIR